MAEFRINGECVAERTHQSGYYTKGNIYTVYGLSGPFCKCIPLMIDIGLKSNGRTLVCQKCNIKKMISDNIFWQDAADFSPIGNLSEANQILMQELVPEHI